jgi:hypothetical protein
LKRRILDRIRETSGIKTDLAQLKKLTATERTNAHDSETEIAS